MAIVLGVLQCQLATTAGEEEQEKSLFVWGSSGSVATVSIIIALTLLTAGSFVLFSPATPMTASALAQEEENDTTASWGQ
jgi:hypothetical protein